MGNEMGNGNTSGLQEDKHENQAPNESSEGSKGSNVAEAVRDDDNKTVPSLDAMDVNQSVIVDGQIQEKKSMGREEEEEARNSNPNATPANCEPISVESVEPKTNEEESTVIVSSESSVKESSELQGGNDDIIESNESSDFMDKGNKLEDAITIEIEKEVAVKETELHGGKIFDIIDTHEEDNEILDQVEGQKGLCRKSKSYSSDVENEGDEKKQPTELYLDSNDPTMFPSSKSTDSLNESDVTNVYLGDDTKKVGHESEIIRNDQNLISVNGHIESGEESKTDKNDISQTEFTVLGSDHDEIKECMGEGSFNSGIERASHIDEAKETQNGYEIDPHGVNSNPDEQSGDIKEETEMVGIAVEREKVTGFPSFLGTSENVGEDLKENIEGSDHQLTEHKPITISVSEEQDGRMDDGELEEEVSSQLGLIENETTFLQPLPISLVQSQEPEQKSNVIESETLEQKEKSPTDSHGENCEMVDVSECFKTLEKMERIVTNPNEENYKMVDVIEDFKFNSGNPSIQIVVQAVESVNEISVQENSLDQTKAQIDEPTFSLVEYEGVNSVKISEELENYRTSNAASNQENQTSEVVVSERKRFEFENQIKENEVLALQSLKEEFTQSPLFLQTETTEGENSATEGCSFETKEKRKNSTGESDQDISITGVDGEQSVSIDLEMPHTKTEASLEPRNDESQVHQTRTESADIYETVKEREISVIETIQECTPKVDSNKISSFDFEIPNAESKDSELVISKEMGAKSLLDQKSSVENEVSTLEGSDSEKLKTPLTRNLKEETYVLEPLQKQEILVVKAVNEPCVSPGRKIMTNSPKEREKHRPRFSLFSNCMCCTAVIQ
ncbi:uncharacterized protein LOC143887482 isoform X2 [Tasmannia lanceolata]|uniref:uncharacterized protein LOC143887482 isoform X2 n=1 Tax=Tasmannia lanceolata TaxID=3420 RepID=UPI0040634D13